VIWNIITIISMWACVLSALACAIAINGVIRVTRRSNVEMKLALSALNDAYRESWEIVHADLDLFNRRITELENRL
jgi:hypothetical protein